MFNHRRFLNEKTDIDRINYSNKLLDRYPDHVPYIIDGSSDGIKMIKYKFFVAKNESIFSITKPIQNFISNKPDGVIYGLNFYCNGEKILSSMSNQDVYNKYHSADGFVYLNITRR